MSINNRSCLKCGALKSVDQFHKWRVGVKSEGEIFSIGNTCTNCFNYSNAKNYLKKQIDSVCKNENYDVITDEHIEIKSKLLELKRKLKKYETN